MAVWRIERGGEAAARRLAGGTGLPRPVAEVLVRRGIATASALRAHLEPRIADLHDPYLMDGMDGTVARLARARETGERVLLFGDYDVDGVAATAAMGKVMEAMGLRYSVCHPDRFGDGYGFNRRGVRAAAERGCGLIVTLDCGTEAAAAVGEARDGGIDVLVIDHHLQRDALPPAVAVVNPKKESCPYPFEDLVSAAVVLKVARALVERVPLSIPWDDLLQLAALATVADVAPLTGENRVIASLGIAAMGRAPLPGLRALARAAAVDLRAINAGHCAFALGPRLNAAGRLGDPSLSTMLLLESDVDRCAEIARDLNRMNSRRQALERAALGEALEQIERGGAGGGKVLVVAGTGWHRGVVGIVAARLIERYNRPAVVIALDGETGHGSARSIPAFDLFGGLSRCRDLLAAFGGHRHAAGLTIEASAVGPFRETINRIADGLLSDGDLEPTIHVDAVAGLDEMDLPLVRLLDRMEPFGRGNPRPVFMVARVRPVRPPRPMGRDGRHISLHVAPAGADGPVLECVGWNMRARIEDLPAGILDIACVPRLDAWGGRERVRLFLKDIRGHVPAEGGRA
ncbi:MAG: single-stranded-DNA-specific exonuclease RecJ [bacterium]|nr:single-stranded-DNA-specific exonuclease RecJ [bacterium]